MPDTSTPTGGGTLTTSLNTAQTQTAATLLDQLSGGAGPTFTTDLSTPPAANGSTVYVITPTQAGEDIVVPAGAGGIVIEGDIPVTITVEGAPGQSVVVVGNSADDTIDVTGGSATVVLGDGDNSVNVSGGATVNVDNFGGDTSVSIAEGTIVASGPGQVNVTVDAGADPWFFSNSGGSVVMGDNSFLELGTGDDTVHALGSATVYGGYDSLIFFGGTNSTVLAGSGNETLYGGTGTTVFYGSNAANGFDSMIGGTGSNLFVGGNNRDTMVAGGTSDTFEFLASVSGGDHTIADFARGDELDLVGYTRADVASVRSHGGSTVITLNDGTIITLEGVKDFNVKDINFLTTPVDSTGFNPDIPGGQSLVPTTSGYDLGSGGTATLLGGDSKLTLSSSSTVSGGQLLVGNRGGDTFNVIGTSATVAAGGGDNTINVQGASAWINTGAGANTINLDGAANGYVFGSGDDTVNVSGGGNWLFSTSGAHIDMANGSSINLGTGDDTITAVGSATVIGGYNNVIFHGGTDSTVYAGSGIETLYGGSGTTDFYGSTSANAYDVMYGGTGSNFFEGGVNADTMYAAGTSNIFDFASSVSGGNHTIVGYTPGDEIELQGYSSADVKNIATVGGSSVITLDDGTSITLKGVSSFNSTQITFHP